MVVVALRGRVRLTRALVAAGLAAIVFPLTSSPAAAQPIAHPERAADVYAPRSEARTSTYTFSLSGLGGYDDNVSEGGGGGGSAPSSLQPGYVGLFDAVFDYRRARGSRFLSLSSSAGLTSYGGDVGLGPSQRAGGGVTVGTDLGRNNSFTAGQAISYDATYGLETLDVLDSAVPAELPTASSVEGVLRRKSWSADSTLGLSRRWGARDTTNISYGFTIRDYIQASSQASHSQHVAASYAKQVNRNVSLNTGYGYSQGEFVGGLELETVRPRGTHNVTGGATWTKRVSPRRTLHLSVSGGGTRVSSETGTDTELTEYTYWSPTASVGARLDLSRTWTLSGNFNRTVTTLDGLTADTFVSDVLGISVGGLVGRRVTLSFSGGLASGTQGEDVLESSEYETYSGAAQVSVQVLRNLSALVQYTYYRYNLTGGSTLPDALPPTFDRNGIRVGFVLSWPPPGRVGRTPTR